MFVRSTASAQLETLLGTGQATFSKDKLNTLYKLLFEIQYAQEEVYKARIIKQTIEDVQYSPLLSVCKGVGKIALSVLGIIAYSPLFAITFICLAVVARGSDSAAKVIIEATDVYSSFARLITDGYHNCTYSRLPQSKLSKKLNKAKTTLDTELNTLKKFKEAAKSIDLKDTSLDQQKLKKVQKCVHKIKKIIKSKGSAFDCFKYNHVPNLDQLI